MPNTIAEQGDNYLVPLKDNEPGMKDAVDTWKVLPFGTDEEIEAEVARAMTALKPNKGYIFSATHNIQEDVPLGNVLAMCRAGHLTNLQSFVLFPC